MRKGIVVAVSVLSLIVATATLARQQVNGSPGGSRQVRGGVTDAGVRSLAALRSEVAKRRADVELMELEHEIDKNVLAESLKREKEFESEDQRSTKAAAAVTEATMLAASFGKLGDFKKEFGDDAALQRQAEANLKEHADSIRGANDRKKKEFAKRTAELNERRLELADLEKQLANFK
jgi:hypothetical protein